MRRKSKSSPTPTYLSGYVKPQFMGAPAPVKSNIKGEKGNINYFVNYRNKIISKFQMPPYEWGLMDKQYSPKADLVAAKLINSNKLSQPLDITYIDRVRQTEIDDFYELCQRHRDQYKDHTGTLHPLQFFSPHENFYQCPPGLSSTYFKYPTSFIQYRSPAVLPRSLERTLRFPDLPERTLYGRYNVRPDNSYKR